MGQFIKQLQDLLEVNFPGSEPHLEQVTPAPRVGGLLIWSDFQGKSQRERQSQVWDVLRGNLDSADQQRITAILTLTPYEKQDILENE